MGRKNNVLLNEFLKASNEAKQMMNESDDIWKKVRPYMNADDDNLFSNLRDIYREGIPKDQFTSSQVKGAKKTLLHPIKYRR